MKTRILLITHDKEFISGLTSELEKFPYEVAVHEGGEVLQVVFDQVPHLILLDEEYDKRRGKNIGLTIKQDVVLKYIPIILIVKDRKVATNTDLHSIDHFCEKAAAQNVLFDLIHETLKKNSNELDVNPLTHLPGTRSSLLWIERILTEDKKFAVLYADLSDLGVFNKAYGDSRGDEVIIRTSELLKKALRMHGDPNDFLGHLGGDDFVIFTAPERSTAIADAMIQSFDNEINSFYDAQDRERGYLVQRDAEGELKQYPVMTISVAIIDNQHGEFTEITEINRAAAELDKAMRTVPGSCYALYNKPKKNSVDGSVENSYKIHFPGRMKSVVIAGLAENPDQYGTFFRTILKEQKIITLYQPLVDVRLKKAVGYEALSRPGAFYPHNEATTLFEIARHLNHVKELDLLCVQLALKRAQGLGPDQKLFINLNHETLLDSQAMRTLFDGKGAIGFKNIVIEITEQSILRSFDKVRDALAELKEQGVSVAIDDLGGGAVSLRDVAVLKPDYIKFDRSLIRQIDVSTIKQQILLSLILFAKGIGASTVAEGIETREEFEAAVMCGAYLAQGYYFAEPGPAFPKPFFGANAGK